jgi:membrane protease YdiL (CAAX protease family)
MIQRTIKAAAEIFIGVATIILTITVIRFAALPIISDSFGWSDTTTSTVRRLLIILAVALIYWSFIRWNKARRATEMAFTIVPIALSGLAGMAIIGFPILYLFMDGSYILQSVQFHPAIFNLALFIFSAAFLEEVLFRGILFSSLEWHFGIKTALIVPSIAFSALHFFNAEWGGTLSFVSGILLGLFWALNFAWTRNIWAVAVNHALWNFTIVLAGLPLTGQNDWLDISPLKSSVSGADWWSGGAAGPENTILTVVILSIVVAAMLWRQFRIDPRLTVEIAQT